MTDEFLDDIPLDEEEAPVQEADIIEEKILNENI